MTRPATVSFVIPVLNEQATLGSLAAAIAEVMTKLGRDFEIVFVDDGSTDASWSTMEALVAASSHVKAVRLRRNFGKATALAAGFRVAAGGTIVTMDADLQDDPSEIPKFLDRLESGFDVVSGWKVRRHDPPSKRYPSKVFNLAVAKLSRIDLHDFNCGFKAYRRRVLENVRLYGELHRFVPVLANDLGFRIAEVQVKHNPRRHGHSKYGWERYARGFIDLLTVLATTRYLQKPGHFFGGVGLAAGALGGLMLAYLACLWALGLGPVGTRPLFAVGILLVTLSIQLVSLGVLAELVNRGTNARPVESTIESIATPHEQPSTVQ